MAVKVKINSSDSGVREANQEFLARRSKRLRENRAALAALSSLGISDVILKNFHLGLSEQYTDTKNTAHENALIAPIISVKGKPSSYSVYFNIPKVTINPLADKFWSRGEPKTYYSGAYKKPEISSRLPRFAGLVVFAPAR